MKNKKQKMMIIALVLVGIVFVTIGATYAFFNYSKAGTEEHTITSGGITFHYQEASQGLTLDDAVPMTDSQGMAQTDYFDFTITSKTMETVDIPYYITVRRSGTGTNMDGVVKVYLTKVDSSNNETPVEIVSGKTIAKVSELGSYINNQGINTPATEKSLYNDKVWAGTENYTQKYRLRMWIDNDAQFIIQQEGQPDFYPYEGKTYTLKVNVYSTGVDIGKSVADLRNNTEINSISVGNSTLVAAGDTFTGDVVLPAGESSTTMSITVDTVNPNSTVQVTRDSQTGFINKTGIKKIATSSNQLVNLGTNNYTITVRSENGRTTDTYHLTLVGKVPAYDLTLVYSNATLNPTNVSVRYNDSSTVSVTPASGYYLSDASCTNGYTITAATGSTAIGEQTVTITNNGQEVTSVCTFVTTPIQYSITYNLNSGTQGSEAPESYNIESVTFNLPTPTRTNYTFGGWFENSDFSGTRVSQIATNTTGNKTYYAKWVTTTYDYAYTGSAKSFTVPATGTYQFDMYGAQGGTDGNTPGGKGARLSVSKHLTAGTVVQYNIGGAGANSGNTHTIYAGGYNGGGSAIWSGGGGGRTDISFGGTVVAAAAGGGGASNKSYSRSGGANYKDYSPGRISTATGGTNSSWQGFGYTSFPSAYNYDNNYCAYDAGAGGAGFQYGGALGVNEDCAGESSGWGGISGYTSDVTLVSEEAGVQSGHGRLVITILNLD